MNKLNLKHSLLTLGTIGICVNLCACQTLNETKEQSSQNGVILNEIKQEQGLLLPAINELQANIAQSNANNEKALSMCLENLSKTTAQNSSLSSSLESCEKQHINLKPQIVTTSCEQKPADPFKLPDGKMIFGEAEWIYIAEAETSFDSRIDSGASVSSINAINIQKFERDGRKWFSFDIPVNTSHLIHVEAPHVRTAAIKKASGNGETEDRPVVSLTIKIGGYSSQAEFTLKDRTTMQYPILIGREFIKDIAIVDVSKIHVQPKLKNTNTIGALKLKSDGTKIPNSQEVKMSKKDREQNIPAKPKTKENKDSKVDKNLHTEQNTQTKITVTNDDVKTKSPETKSPTMPEKKFSFH